MKNLFLHHLIISIKEPGSSQPTSLWNESMNQTLPMKWPPPLIPKLPLAPAKLCLEPLKITLRADTLTHILRVQKEKKQIWIAISFALLLLLLRYHDPCLMMKDTIRIMTPIQKVITPLKVIIPQMNMLDNIQKKNRMMTLYQKA